MIHQVDLIVVDEDYDEAQRDRLSIESLGISIFCANYWTDNIVNTAYIVLGQRLGYEKIQP